ncbi:MAG: dihydrolipoamide acetyltransferase family protein [Pseudomonadota bacterium]
MMPEHTINLPDIGEGVAEAELVEWCVDIGRNVLEDEVLGHVMTDKATVEIPSPVEGKVVWLGADVGDLIAVGSPLVRLETDQSAQSLDTIRSNGDITGAADETPGDRAQALFQDSEDGVSGDAYLSRADEAATSANRRDKSVGTSKTLAAPVVRARARDLGIDLASISGSGPDGRVLHTDLDRILSVRGNKHQTGDQSKTVSVETPIAEIRPIVGLRRKIAGRMAQANARVAHITYVEEIDVTAMEEARAALSAETGERITPVAFIGKAVALATKDHPSFNAHFDDETEKLSIFDRVDLGLATQTDNGLVVPVIRGFEELSLSEAATKIAGQSEAAREGRLDRSDMVGSTITLTSLGALGGIITTPIINLPEVAIIGVNKIQVRPQWDGATFAPRKMMNLSGSFDHRIIDGYDAAVFVQRIKSLLEAPILLA